MVIQEKGQQPFLCRFNYDFMALAVEVNLYDDYPLPPRQSLAPTPSFS
jgi:hypothetical protein